MTRTPTPTSCDKKKERVVTDGWYASVPVPLMCRPWHRPPFRYRVTAVMNKTYDHDRRATRGKPLAYA